MDTFEEIQKKIELMKAKSVMAEDMKQFLVFVSKLITDAKYDFSKISKENLKLISEAVDFVNTECAKTSDEAKKSKTAMVSEFDKKIKEVNKFLEEIKKIESTPGEPGADADEEAIFERLKALIPEKSKKITFAQVIDLINSAPVNPDNQIDASHIKNLPEMVKTINNTRPIIVEAPRDDKMYARKNRAWVEITSTGGTVGPGTINEIAYFDSANTITSLAVATYPSLAELARIKGLTSAVQGQLDGKQATLVSGTNIKTINGASVLGSGDLTVVGGSGITRAITVTSGSATMGDTASTDYVYLVAGAHTMTLPTAVGNTNRYTVKNNHSAAITVNTTSSQTIDGTTSISINPQSSVDIISNNTNWYII